MKMKRRTTVLARKVPAVIEDVPQRRGRGVAGPLLRRARRRARLLRAGAEVGRRRAGFVREQPQEPDHVGRGRQRVPALCVGQGSGKSGLGRVSC